ncbi:hypothetical protein BDR05DRAFT_1005520 [Suillus weaverae]|nr:hypothetical protein BDR05DRAFT_1005520 [Suillus weaverae]
MLSDAVARIEETINCSSSIYAQRHVSLPPQAVGFIPKRQMYVFTVNVSVRQFITNHLENQGLKIVISPWIPSHIYMTSDSPNMIFSMFPNQFKSSIKNWDVVKEDKQAEVNMLQLQFPYPAWLRIKQAPQYVDPSEEAKSIEIGNCIRVTIGDLIGRSGLVVEEGVKYNAKPFDNDILLHRFEAMQERIGCDMAKLRQENAELRKTNAELMQKNTRLKDNIKELGWDNTGLKQDNIGLKHDIKELMDEMTRAVLGDIEELTIRTMMITKVEMMLQDFNDQTHTNIMAHTSSEKNILEVFWL